MRVWVDVDNPPQARYLLPLARRFAELGHDLVLTARDYGDTLAILESEGASYEAIGERFGKGLSRKLGGLLGRARELNRFLQQQAELPRLVVTASRSAALAGRRLRIPSFVIIDYEFVDLIVYRFSGAHIVHPSIIDSTRFRRRGFPAKRLIPFEGLKEDLTFAGVDADAIEAHDFGAGDAPVILFRPPAEESHYFRPESREFALELLRHLAAAEAQIVFSPRFPSQVVYLDAVARWPRDPIVLREPIPVVPLLKGVDGVVSAGGTMLREAAFLGVPAYSVFRSRIGAVDRYLESIGRLRVLRSSADFDHVALRRAGRLQPLRIGTTTAAELAARIAERALTPRSAHEGGEAQPPKERFTEL